MTNVAAAPACALTATRVSAVSAVTTQSRVVIRVSTCPPLAPIVPGGLREGANTERVAGGMRGNPSVPSPKEPRRPTSVPQARARSRGRSAAADEARRDVDHQRQQGEVEQEGCDAVRRRGAAHG